MIKNLTFSKYEQQLKSQQREHPSKDIYTNNTVRGFCHRNFIIVASIEEYFIKLNIGILV